MDSNLHIELEEIINQEGTLELRILGPAAHLNGFIQSLKKHIDSTQRTLKNSKGYVFKTFDRDRVLPGITIPFNREETSIDPSVDDAIQNIVIKAKPDLVIQTYSNFDQIEEIPKVRMEYIQSRKELVVTTEDWLVVDPREKFLLYIALTDAISRLPFIVLSTRTTELGLIFKIDDSNLTKIFTSKLPQKTEQAIIEGLKTANNMQDFDVAKIAEVYWMSMPGIEFKWIQQIITEEGVEIEYSITDIFDEYAPLLKTW